MSTEATTVLESVRKTDGAKGTDKGNDEKDPEKGKGKGTASDVEKALGLVEDDEDEKVQKWRFLAKGPALDAILAVFGARAVEGEKQVSFKVKAAGDRELGDVVRALFLKAQAAGVTLADLIKLVNQKAGK